MAADREPRAAARRELRHGRRQHQPGVARRAALQRRAGDHELRRRRLLPQCRLERRHRDDQALHHRCSGAGCPARVPPAPARPGPFVRGARPVVPDEHRSERAAHLRQRLGARRQPHAGDPDVRDALLDGAAARPADGAAAVRQPRRVFLRHPARLRHRRAARRVTLLHHALAARAEGPQCRGERSDQADRVLHRSGHAAPVGPLAHQGRAGVGAAVPRRRVLERDPGAPGAHAAGGPGFRSGRRPLFHYPVAAVHDRERLRPAHQRSAHR